jgi:hypothetical protein
MEHGHLGTEELTGPPNGQSRPVWNRWQQWLLCTVREAAWPPAALVIFHLIALCVFDAYIRFPPLDLPMHFLGGVVCGYFLHRASLNASACGIFAPYNALTHHLLVFALTCSVTVFWEFAEFTSDHLFGSHTQLGLTDTIRDMLIGTLGGVATLAGTHLRRSERPG